jgi:hypothetical protein
MQVHARISKEWRRRMVFLFAMIFGSAIWFLTDGYLMWPAEARRHETFKTMAESLIAEGRATDLKDPVVLRAWERHAEEQQLSPKVPKERTPAAIAGQVWTGWIMLAGSVLFGTWVIWNHRRSVRAEGDTVIGPSGERVSLDSIVEIDRRKWASKGIAYALYEENGRRKRLTLDDHKFLGCEAIILEAEKRIAARQGSDAAQDDDSGAESPRSEPSTPGA